MKKIGALLVVCCFLMTTVTAQEVAKVVKAYPHDKAIMVEYDLSADAELVRLFVSLDGGETYRGPLQQVSGDLSEVQAGFSRSIRWEVLDELGLDAFESDEVRFKLNILLKERWPRETFVTLNAAYALLPQGSVGVSFGQVKRFGWFVSVMSNLGFSGFGVDGDCDAQGFLPDGHLMQYTGETAKTRLSVMAGGLMHLTGSLMARVGVGYGNRTLCWQSTDGAWYRNTASSWSGLDLSAGLQWHHRGVALSMEAVTTQFQTMEAKIGVGVVF